MIRICLIVYYIIASIRASVNTVSLPFSQVDRVLQWCYNVCTRPAVEVRGVVCLTLYLSVSNRFNL